MNNREAYEYLVSKGSVREATTDFLECFDLEEEKFHCIRGKFAELKNDRVLFRKKNNISTLALNSIDFSLVKLTCIIIYMYYLALLLLVLLFHSMSQ